MGWYARRTAKLNVQKSVPNTLPTAWATFAFCDGMTRASAVAQPARIDKMSTALTMRIRRLPELTGSVATRQLVVLTAVNHSRP
jgi:hypothetical protein